MNNKDYEYIVIRHSTVMPETCSGCSFGGKTICYCYSKGEMIAEWIDNINKGYDITVFKRIDLEVVVKNDN